MTELATFAEFARLQGWDRSTVTRMAQRNRLVIVGQGRDRLVDVAKSRAAIEATRGARDDVAARHAQERAGRVEVGQGITQPGKTQPPPDLDTQPVLDAMDEARRIKVMAESRRVAAAADREEMERDKLAGDLIAREDVDAAMKFLGATVRGLLDVFPDQTAPIVAPTTSLEEVHAQLTEACRNVLVGLGEAIERQRAVLSGTFNEKVIA